jgi:hypothetical protein
MIKKSIAIAFIALIVIYLVVHARSSGKETSDSQRMLAEGSNLYYAVGRSIANGLKSQDIDLRIKSYYNNIGYDMNERVVVVETSREIWGVKEYDNNNPIYVVIIIKCKGSSVDMIRAVDVAGDGRQLSPTEFKSVYNSLSNPLSVRHACNCDSTLRGEP